MVRTQVMLTEEQIQGLKKLAAERRTSMADLIREGVDRILADQERKRLWDRSMEAMGMFNCGPSDVSERHDDYLEEEYADGHVH